MSLFAQKLLTKSKISQVCKISSRAFVSSRSHRSRNNKFEQALLDLKKYIWEEEEGKIYLGKIQIMVLGIYGREEIERERDYYLATTNDAVKSPYAELVTKYRTEMIRTCFNLEESTKIEDIPIVDNTEDTTWESYEGKSCLVVRNPHIEDQLKKLNTAFILGDKGYITVSPPFWNPDSITFYNKHFGTFVI